MSTGHLIIICVTAIICAFCIACGLSDMGGK